MTTSGLTRIGQIAITVKDVERSVAFYRDSLGMKLLFQAPPNLAFLIVTAFG
jgi:methylmalonyl-CoA/ethylmalonyl-CoA epimerase